MILNIIVITLILVIVGMAVYYVFKKDLSQEQSYSNDYDIDNLVKEIKATFNNILNTNIAELSLNKAETEKREKLKMRLSKALRSCSFGDVGEKEYVKDYIKNLLEKHFNINPDTIDKVINFSTPNLLSVQDKFDILLYLYKKEYRGNAFEELLKHHNISEIKINEDGEYYEINTSDIINAYKERNPKLSFVDKLEIVAQRIYQNDRGHGVIDELRDQDCLDGVSGGVSGLTNNDYNYLDEVIFEEDMKGMFRYDSVWIFFHGRSVHLSFLSFGSQRELERVCKNIYRYDAPYFLSGQKGKIVTEDKSGNRITVARPPFTESWKFFIRKFQSISTITPEELIKDKGSEKAISCIEFIVKGNQVIAVTGDQGSGKTTLVKAIVRFIRQQNTLRVEEEVFELWLSKLYRNRNISTFRKTATISLQEGMDFQKKTDGDVLIFGEVASQEPAALLVQLTQFTKQTLFTGHWRTVEKLVGYFTNAMAYLGICKDERLAEKQVAEALNFDIHMERAKDGHRYIKRITEIIPASADNGCPDNFKESLVYLCKFMTRQKMFDYVDIVAYENGEYIIKNKISDSKLELIKENLTDEENLQMEKLFADNLNGMEACNG